MRATRIKEEYNRFHPPAPPEPLSPATWPKSIQYHQPRDCATSFPDHAECDNSVGEVRAWRHCSSSSWEEHDCQADGVWSDYASLQEAFRKDRIAIMQLLEAQHNALLHEASKLCVAQPAQRHNDEGYRIEHTCSHDQFKPDMEEQRKVGLSCSTPLDVEDTETSPSRSPKVVVVVGKEGEEEQDQRAPSKQSVAQESEASWLTPNSWRKLSLSTPTKLRSGSDLSSYEGKNKMMRFFSKVVSSSWFETIFACLIALNAFGLAVEAQYHGLGIGYEIGLEAKPKEEAWPWGVEAFHVMAILFGVAFTIEVLLKTLVMGLPFFQSYWNWFDVVIVGLWAVESMLSSSLLPVNPLILRLVRLIRLLRLLRLVKTFQLFDTLRLMVGSLKASMDVQFWSFTFLFFLMMTGALLLHYLAEPYIVGNNALPIADQHQMYEYFGTFARSMLSMFELTLGNWVPITRFLCEKGNEWYIPFLLIYHCIVAFAIVTVIRGIFLHETFQVAANDDELMIMKKERQTKKDIAKIKQLFNEADDSVDGLLSQAEFKNVLTDPRVKVWLAAMGIDASDPELLFALMDRDSDNLISPDEFVRGFGRLRGPARSIDLLTLLHVFILTNGSSEALDKSLDAGFLMKTASKSTLQKSLSQWRP